MTKPTSIALQTAFLAILCSAFLNPLAPADSPPPRWNPSSVIDSSELIVVAEPMDPPQRWPVAIDQGSPIGVVMELRVLRVLDGRQTALGTINVFQHAGGMTEFQPIADAKFVLFLRELGKEDRAMLKKVQPGRMPVVKKFTELKDEDVVWTLSSPSDQWMAYFPLKKGDKESARSILQVQLSSVGVGSSVDPLDYLIRIIKLRRSSRTARLSFNDDGDPFLKQAASE